MTDTEIKSKGIEILTDGLGLVEAERFVSLIAGERFDYTEWQRTLFEDMSVQELNAAAMASWNRKNLGEPLSIRKKYRDRYIILPQDGAYRWIRVGGQGNVLEESTTTFPDQAACLAAVNAL